LESGGEAVSDSEELKYPSWQIPLRKAVLEADPEKLAKRITQVEALIAERLQTIASATHHQDEREAIADAASILRVLKKGEL
jgi:hypothetical protein